MNVDDYLARIKYNGLREPTLQTLRQLFHAHIYSVPFSSYATFGGPRCLLDYEDMYHSIVTRGQGSLCYALGGLFTWLLRQLGFDVKMGHAKFWLDGKLTVPHFHLLPIVGIVGVLFLTLLLKSRGFQAVIGNEKWLCDVSWLLHEPIKIEPMKPMIQKNGIYRLRESDSDEWFHLEVLRKTVLDKDGNVVEQGPKLTETIENVLECNEMKSFDSNLWKAIYQFTTKDQPISAFKDMCNYFQDDEDSPTRKQLYNHMFTRDGSYRMGFGQFVVKEYVDPLTEKILVVQNEFKSNQEIVDLTEKYSGIKLDFELKFFSE